MDSHSAAHALVELIAAIALVGGGLVVLGLGARRNRQGRPSGVVRATRTGGGATTRLRASMSIWMVPLDGLLMIAAVVALSTPSSGAALPH